MKKFTIFITLFLITTFFAFAERRNYSYVPDIYCSYFELTPEAYKKICSTKHGSVAEILNDIRKNDIEEKCLKPDFIYSEAQLAMLIGGIHGPDVVEDALTCLENHRFYFYWFTITDKNIISLFYFYK